MKKIIFICFLGGLCLVGSEVHSKVASPWSTPAQIKDSVGQGRGALIYGEIINPDSLKPVELVFSPLQLKPGLQWEEVTVQQEILPGEFFDGILDPRVQKFKVQLPPTSESAYLSLKIEGRTLLENFLVFPADSVMIAIDLSTFQIVFGGPEADWFEAQYAVQRAKEKYRFQNPRVLFEIDREKLLSTDDNREKWEKANGDFGSRLQIWEQGKDGLDWEIAATLTPEFQIPARNELENWKGKIAHDRFNLLQTELISAYLAEKLSSLRRYGVSMSRTLKDTAALDKINRAYPTIKLQYDIRLKGLQDWNSSGYLNLVHEWVLFRAAVEQRPVANLIITGYEGEVRERLLFTTLYSGINRSHDPANLLAEYDQYFQLPTWRGKWENLTSRYALNIPLLHAELTNLNGEKLSLDSFSGKPTLLYFYFSTCSHSANFFKNYLWPIYQGTVDSAGYQLIAVSVDNDPELWKNSISEYSNPELTNLNLPSKENRAWLDHYLFTGYPRTILLDVNGNLLSLKLKGENYEDFKSKFLQLLETSDPINTNPSKPLN